MDKEILRMQIRLFRLACKRWGMDTAECAKIFDDNNVDEYVIDLYEVFHIQSDEADLEEIEAYLDNRGVKYAFK